jgi:hypothetical protein
MDVLQAYVLYADLFWDYPGGGLRRRASGIGGQWPDLTFACVGTPDALMHCDDGLTLGGSHDNVDNFIR